MMRYITNILTIIMLSGFMGCDSYSPVHADYNHDILWYDEPAEKWEEALPVGNGRIGAMVFGDPHHERIQLNDDSMWPPDLDWEEPEGTPEDLEHIRHHLFEGNHVEADQLFVEKFSNKSIVRSHQTTGDLYIDLDHGEITDYRRELDLTTATAKTTYRADGALITEKVFVSHPSQVIVITLESEAEEGLSGKISINRPDDNGKSTYAVRTYGGGEMLMMGEITQHGGKFRSEPAPITAESDTNVTYRVWVQIKNDGGRLIDKKGYYQLENVRAATIFVYSLTTTYQNNSNYKEENFESFLSMDLKDIWQEHVNDHRELYSRVYLDLGGNILDSLPTDKRLERVKEGHPDPGLEALLFQYGRYLLIGSSRPGTYPANLQGLWNQHIEAPWNADYHLNINLQMNYWPANLTDLHELNMPLFDFIDRLVENGKLTAMNNFGCRGSFFPHATDFWAPTWLRAPTAYWGCSMGAGGWMMQHYWNHFLFTGDTSLLRDRAFPAMHEVAQFYSDWLIEDPRDGFLVSAPSTSPENRFFDTEGRPVASCLGSAMDMQVISEVFDNYIEACDILDVKNELLTVIRNQKERLRPGFVIGTDGRILEWDREYKEPEPGHRHMSHLYGFHPGVAVTKDGTPETYDAVRKTLDYRLENGGAGTGWSRAWLINCSARLLDGNMAYDHIQLLFKKSMFSNLFDAHPPFQIDGNFGYTAGIAEMLLQSYEDGIIRLLPALPDAWPEGSVSGLCARGGYKFSMNWEKGVLKHLSVQSAHGGEVKLICDEKEVKLKTSAGETLYIDW